MSSRPSRSRARAPLRPVATASPMPRRRSAPSNPAAPSTGTTRWDSRLLSRTKGSAIAAGRFISRSTSGR